jgi:hypothetical protein
VTGSVNKSEGDLDIKGTVDFKEYVGGNEGSVTIYYIHPNGGRYYAGSKPFEGATSLEWTWKNITGYIPDAGSWAQGKYTIQVIAKAANGASKQTDIPITIDNTPEVTGSVNKSEGDLDIKGTVDFKEYVGGNEGSVTIYYIHPNGGRYYAGSKPFEGAASLEWTWKDTPDTSRTLVHGLRGNTPSKSSQKRQMVPQSRPISRLPSIIRLRSKSSVLDVMPTSPVTSWARCNSRNMSVEPRAASLCI